MWRLFAKSVVWTSPVIGKPAARGGLYKCSRARVTDMVSGVTSSRKLCTARFASPPARCSALCPLLATSLSRNRIVGRITTLAQDVRYRPQAPTSASSAPRCRRPLTTAWNAQVTTAEADWIAGTILERGVAGDGIGVRAALDVPRVVVDLGRDMGLTRLHTLDARLWYWVRPLMPRVSCGFARRAGGRVSLSLVRDQPLQTLVRRNERIASASVRTSFAMNASFDSDDCEQMTGQHCLSPLLTTPTSPASLLAACASAVSRAAGRPLRWPAPSGARLVPGDSLSGVSVRDSLHRLRLARRHPSNKPIAGRLVQHPRARAIRRGRFDWMRSRHRQDARG